MVVDNDSFFFVVVMVVLGWTKEEVEPFESIVVVLPILVMV